jgi:hypothetical protein
MTAIKAEVGEIGVVGSECRRSDRIGTRTTVTEKSGRGQHWGSEWQQQWASAGRPRISGWRKWRRSGMRARVSRLPGEKLGALDPLVRYGFESKFIDTADIQR